MAKTSNDIEIPNYAWAKNLAKLGRAKELVTEKAKADPKFKITEEEVLEQYRELNGPIDEDLLPKE
jgi:hypothetical protein